VCCGTVTCTCTCQSVCSLLSCLSLRCCHTHSFQLPGRTWSACMLPCQTKTDHLTNDHCHMTWPQQPVVHNSCTPGILSYHPHLEFDVGSHICVGVVSVFGSSKPAFSSRLPGQSWPRSATAALAKCTASSSAAARRCMLFGLV
jgi:hypothetical protein